MEGITEETECTTAELAAWLGVSDRAVRDFAARGLLTKTGRGKFRLMPSVRSYCGHLRAVAAGHKGDGEGESLDLTAERARLAKAQREKIEAELAMQRGEVVAATAVTAAAKVAFAAVKARIMRIPDIASRLAALPRGEQMEHDLWAELHDECRRAIVESRAQLLGEMGKNEE